LLMEHRRGAISEVKEYQLLPQGRVRLSKRQSLLLQLTAMYRPTCWWMPSFILLRRLLLILVLTVVRSSAVWIWMTFLNYLFLALHQLVAPYERSRDNTLETLTLLSLSVQTTLLSAWPPPFLSPALLAAFNALVIGPLLPLIIEALAGLLRSLRVSFSQMGRGDGELEERLAVGNDELD
jgi:hypothetical protein